MSLLQSLFSPSSRIDYRIADLVPPAIKRQLIVHNVELPTYRFVDLHNAAAAFCEPRHKVDRIETQQAETLNQLIHDAAPQWADRSVRRATKTAWQTGPQQETYLPVDCFWVCPAQGVRDTFVLRLSFDEVYQKARLEVACGETDAGKAALAWIIEHSRKHSIYRNYVLQLSYEAGKKDEYGDIEKPERFQVNFSSIEPVTDTDIVLADEHLSVLKRNVIDLHQRRTILEANGVPARRGILLHGPPGTGKTFACRFLCHKLEGVTRIFVTGSSLLNVSAVFSFARLLQPAVLFLEDVDLIFASREINLYSSALGDLLDQMDGLRSHENISVILTTNAIERLEAAIKDRPGRISQCIYMGAPAADQRRLFIAHQLVRHNADAIDLDRLVRSSEGATQAFLKEWVHRAVQVACERLHSDGEKAAIEDRDFDVALEEMRSFLHGSDGSIIGFVGRR
jgi:SpoVK/Ycf46/Vps4 family AAA+-type ATPase